MSKESLKMEKRQPQQRLQRLVIVSPLPAASWAPRAPPLVRIDGKPRPLDPLPAYLGSPISRAPPAKPR